MKFLKKSLMLLSLGNFVYADNHASDENDKVLQDGLVLDLDAAKGVSVEDGDKVFEWKNQAPTKVAQSFVKQDEGRKEKGSGRPQLKRNVEAIKGHPTLVFRQQELVNGDEDAFDDLSKGSGHTWITVVCAYEQRVGLKDVNAIFGNLKNGGKYEGFWGGLNDNNTPWMGTRNNIGKNTKLSSKTPLVEKKFYILAGRTQKGTGKVKSELFVSSTTPEITGESTILPESNPSKMVVGQERDATNHPGHESFDGEIARLLIYKKPLSDAELKKAMNQLSDKYGVTLKKE